MLLDSIKECVGKFLHKICSSLLKEDEIRYRELFLNAPIAYQSLDQNGKILKVNSVWLDLLGYSLEEVVGKNIKTFLLPEFHAIIDNQFDQFKNAGKLNRVECALKDVAGETVWVSVNGRAHYDATGQFQHSHCVLTDITELKRLEDIYGKLNSRKELLLELSHLSEQDESKILDRVVHNIASLCDSSIGYLSILNQDESDMMQITYTAPDKSSVSEEKLHAVLHACAEHKKPIVVNKEAPDGLIENYMNVPVLDKDNVVAVFGVGNKTTQYTNADVEHLSTVAESVWRIIQKKRALLRNLGLEKQLRESQKMEAIGTLAGGLSHDFNNILQVVSGYSELLLLEIDAEKVPRREFAEAIQEAANKGSRLTGQLKYLSEREKSYGEPMDLNGSIRSLVSFMERTIPKIVDIDFNLCDNLNIIVADVGQVEQVVMNLALNAVHAMPNGGKLCISTRNKKVTALGTSLEPGEYVVLEIADTGNGIAEENLNKIFNPFFTTKKNTKFKGSGLGLSVVYGIIKNHKGRIYCDSVVGKGTTFTIYLPAAEDMPQPPKKIINLEKSGQSKANNEAILVVDDESAILSLEEKLLTEKGYSVITADSGNKALDLYTSRDNIDLVILDLNMPIMSGNECLERLLAYDPEAKIIIASGYSEEGPVGESMSKGALGYIQKPFESAELLITIRDILDR